MALRLFSGVWGGEQFLDTFERGIATSMSWPLNRAALKDAIWDIATEEKNFERLKAAREKCGVTQGSFFNIHAFQSAEHQFTGYLYDVMKICIRNNDTFLFALPDFIYGDGTIPNLLSCMVDPYACLAVPNARMLPETLDIISKSSFTNAQLVSLAFNPDFIHQTWTHAEAGKETINSYYGGVVWKNIAPDLVYCTHRLPSPFMCRFNDSDLEFFSKQLAFSAFDHVFPSKLIEDGRYRYISSSDVAFMAEITEKDSHPSFNLPVSKDGPSVFHRSLLHNRLNAMVISSFRKG